jgi:PTH1 family peptidyl-tRNA hydrolase
MDLLRLFGIFGHRKSLAQATTAFVGLGNPGVRYAPTRHNVGFRVIDALEQSLSGRRHPACCASRITTGIADHGARVVLAKPQTYVNRSGEAYSRLLRKTGLPSTSCLVIVDDFHLAAGSVRLRRRGSDGGHNGLKSIIEHAGRDFPRLRVGIGPLPHGMSVIDFVLGEFRAEEEEAVAEGVETAARAAHCFSREGIDTAMNEFN